MGSAQFIYESEVASFRECVESWTQKVVAAAHIERDAEYSRNRTREDPYGSRMESHGQAHEKGSGCPSASALTGQRPGSGDSPRRVPIPLEGEHVV